MEYEEQPGEKGTSLYLEEKIQIFQSDYASHHCYKCVPSASYAFFSNDDYTMMKYSSNWFSDSREPTPLDPLPLPQIEEAVSEVSVPYNYRLTDIGFCRKMPLLPTYLENGLFIETKHRKETEDIRDKTVKQTKSKKNKIKSFVQVSDKGTVLTQLPCDSSPTVSSFTAASKSNNELPPFGKVYSKISHQKSGHHLPWFVTKFATSKFGRTRKVLDFQQLEKGA